MLQDTVVIGGECSLETRIEGDCDLTSMVEGDPDVLVVEGGGQTYPHYSGSYVVTPSASQQVLQTDGKVMDNDVTVQAVAQGSATTPQTIITADPTISVSSGGLITAQVNKTQQITPTVQEGYVSVGTPGNVGVAGSDTQQLTTQGAQTIHPASTDQSIASGKYLTGAQTFKAVTVSGLTADKILQGNVVKIGDADDDDRIMSVTGTASGGITPTGTKSITANGTGIDVYSYQYADVAVPNSYSAGDEGKVVSNGALVAQTSDTVTANDTYDTTLINSLTVNVSGGASGGLANMVNVTDTDVSFAYMLSAMKNGNTTGGTVTYTTAFTNTDTLILSTGLTTLHGIMFAPTSYDTKNTSSNVQSNKFVLIQLYDDENPTKYVIYSFCGNNNALANSTHTLGTAYSNAPENGTISVSGGDVYFKGRYNKNASYQLLMTNIQYEWIAW